MEPDRLAKFVEVLGLLLLVSGVAGLVTVAFQVTPLLGWAALSTAALALGVVMTVRDT